MPPTPLDYENILLPLVSTLIIHFVRLYCRVGNNGSQLVLFQFIQHHYKLEFIINFSIEMNTCYNNGVSIFLQLPQFSDSQIVSQNAVSSSYTSRLRLVNNLTVVTKNPNTFIPKTLLQIGLITCSSCIQTSLILSAILFYFDSMLVF